MIGPRAPNKDSVHLVVFRLTLLEMHDAVDV